MSQYVCLEHLNWLRLECARLAADINPKGDAQEVIATARILENYVRGIKPETVSLSLITANEVVDVE